jgi:hypothetical protein
MRHGSRIATSPPASRIARKVASRSKRSYGTHQLVLGHRTRDVGVVVLHTDLDRFGAPARVLRGQVLRMQVVRDDFWRDAEESFHPLD